MTNANKSDHGLGEPIVTRKFRDFVSMIRSTLPKRKCFLGIGIVSLAVVGQPVYGTWSFVVADSDTKELAVATVTCVEGLDLLAVSPVIVVGKGVATCQAFADFDGIRRPIIRTEFEQMTDPVDILAAVAGIEGHQSRQYGFADTLGRTATFTGTDVFTILAHAEGITGSQGSMVYSIQGNVVTGSCLVADIETALLNTPGALPEKVVAAVAAARDAGGDGRCSCHPTLPDSCGCPPASFVKTGHIGGIVISRIGDTDDPVCNVNGCVDGDYYLRLNVAGKFVADPPPTDQLLDQFNTWRTTLIGRIDAVTTEVVITPPTIPADGSSTATMQISPKDWQGNEVTTPVTNLSVIHAPDSDGVTTISAVNSKPDGSFTVELTAGVETGTDRFRVVAEDGIRPVTLMPDPNLAIVNDGPVPAANTWSIIGMMGTLLICAVVVLRRSSYQK